MRRSGRVLFQEPGRAGVSMKKGRRVHNQIQTIHALAMGNLCGHAAGLLMELPVPASHRWTAKGTDLRCLQPATAAVTANAGLDKSVWAKKEEVQVPLSVRDQHGVEVVSAMISLYIPEKANEGAGTQIAAYLPHRVMPAVPAAGAARTG